ncbi:hypothetical protein Pka01_67800 [Planotetraspora kaengkrachanensis]|uniref:Uncharacterized protein n=1 Tax=Planotetraspora kaengkrachanensis TaxID=575193 RepID=A0A8J3VB21_9ACTN|nr:hypothetical protein Pka01_67800 [Planotetraspora kaengkrachanensis]
MISTPSYPRRAASSKASGVRSGYTEAVDSATFALGTRITLIYARLPWRLDGHVAVAVRRLNPAGARSRIQPKPDRHRLPLRHNDGMQDHELS